MVCVGVCVSPENNASLLVLRIFYFRGGVDLSRAGVTTSTTFAFSRGAQGGMKK